MKAILLSTLFALSVLAGMAGSASAGDPECQGFMRNNLDCWPEDRGP
jgi:hypothetical protein